jgi:hypothetical protein
MPSRNLLCSGTLYGTKPNDHDPPIYALPTDNIEDNRIACSMWDSLSPTNWGIRPYVSGCFRGSNPTSQGSQRCSKSPQYSFGTERLKIVTKVTALGWVE